MQGTGHRHRIALALGLSLVAGCVKTDLPLDRIVGTYEIRDRYAGTRVRLMADRTAVIQWWSCKESGMIRGRWVQEGDGVL